MTADFTNTKVQDGQGHVCIGNQSTRQGSGERLAKEHKQNATLVNYVMATVATQQTSTVQIGDEFFKALTIVQTKQERDLNGRTKKLYAAHFTCTLKEWLPHTPLKGIDERLINYSNAGIEPQVHELHQGLPSVEECVSRRVQIQTYRSFTAPTICLDCWIISIGEMLHNGYVFWCFCTDI